MITEGTSKFAAAFGENDKHLAKILQRQLHNGVVSSFTEVVRFILESIFCNM